MNEAAMSLPNSNDPAITITSLVAPANSLDNPKTLKKAALPAIQNADNPTRNAKNLLLVMYILLLFFVTY
jgi:hypothetical protein